ncbi:MAG: ATP-dependent 6-phosphofructokinase [Desulfobacterales bacterium]
MKTQSIDTEIPILGVASIPSPIGRGEDAGHGDIFVSDQDRVLIDVGPDNLERTLKEGGRPSAFELAGPRDRIYFDPSKLRCAVVTCGGLCPGLNDVIRSIVLALFHGYGVRHIYGIRYGLQGLVPEFGHDYIELTPDTVSGIHEKGGSILGSSRGPQPIGQVVDSLERMGIGLLFMVGGDGTLMAATRIADAIEARGLKIGVVCIPKTIDNDIHLVSRSFGFDTAVDVATQAIISAHNEAEGYPNGIGLIKLMGRYSGFIAATAALAQQDVNFVLIPEVDFQLEGSKGFLAHLERRLEQRGHAVIIVAEGAGQKFFEEGKSEADESGNIRLKDIGLFLKDAIASYFTGERISVSVKYIDPSYMIRSLPANANDNVFCSFLGRDAVHAGMAGKTKLLVGYWNNNFVYMPLSACAGKRKQVDRHGKLWHSILEATGQAAFINDGSSPPVT